jgi:hypothetical protein
MWIRRPSRGSPRITKPKNYSSAMQFWLGWTVDDLFGFQPLATLNPNDPS